MAKKIQRAKHTPTRHMTLMKGALVGGLILFFWTNISWMMIGWHQAYMKPVPNEAILGKGIKTAISENGLYVLPHHKKGDDMETMKKQLREGPFAYMMIMPNGKEFGLGKMMVRGFLFSCLVGLIATWLLLQTSGLSLWQKVGFIKVVGLIGTGSVFFAHWNWWSFPNTYLLVNIVDQGFAFGWLGLGLSKLVVNKK